MFGSNSANKTAKSSSDSHLKQSRNSQHGAKSASGLSGRLNNNQKSAHIGNDNGAQTSSTRKNGWGNTDKWREGGARAERAERTEAPIFSVFICV